MKLLILFCVNAVAVIFDYVTGKIPNILILLGFFCGIILQVYENQVYGAARFLAGAAVPVIVLFALHFFKMLGAGDIKLLMISGGFLGPAASFKIIFFSFLTAAIISLAALIKHRIMKRRLKYLIQYLQRFLMTRKWEPYICEERNPAYVHMAFPIFFGTLLVAGGVI